MKTFLWAGAILMTGASIYGFIDYKKTSHDKGFTKMYSSDEATNSSDKKQADTKNTTIHNEADLKTQNETVIKKKPEPVTEEKSGNKSKMTINNVEPVKTQDIGATNVTPKPVNIKKKKILSYKLFSRAPLEEKYIDKEFLNDSSGKKQQ